MKKLTRAQREQWAIDGYIRVEGALSADQVAFFDAELDRVRQLPGWEPSPTGRSATTPGSTTPSTATPRGSWTAGSCSATTRRSWT